MIVSQFVFQLISLAPITLDLSAPYISSLYLCLGTVIVLATYGFHTAMRGRQAPASCTTSRRGPDSLPLLGTLDHTAGAAPQVRR